MRLPKNLSPAVVLAFAIVYTVWGSTYFANLVAIETIPAFGLIVARLTVAGAILLLVARLRGGRAVVGKPGAAAPDPATHWRWPTRREWRNLTLTAFLFLTVGLGAVVWAEHYIESGTTALLVAAEPLIVVLVLWGFDRRRPRWQAFLGIALGILGTLLLVGQDLVISGTNAWWGVGAILVGITAWAFGSVLTARLALPPNRVLTAGWQMLIAGSLALPLTLAFDSYAGFSLASVSERSWLAYGFLVVFGSIIAYSAFLFLLQRVSPEKVATSTYVHPVVALSLGVWLGDEVVTGQTLVACAVMLTGVLLINGRWGDVEEGASAKPVVQPRQANAGVVVRRWRGRARAGQEERLAAFLDEVVAPHMRSVDGNLDVRIERGDPAADAPFAVESHWRDEDAVTRYVDGADVARPRYYNGEEGLVEREGQEVWQGRG